MKKQRLKAAILVGIVAIIGCNRADEPQAPTLISPADGAALYSGLAFIWGTGEEAEEYVIHVWTGSTDVIEDTLTDTTYTMSDSAFSALAYGIYNWAVASKADSKLAWSESWSFSLTQPAAPAPTLIAPEDGAVFYREAPTFIWRSNPLGPDYVIRIFTDTTIVLQDTLSDTSYVMSVSVFDILENGTYDWWVGTVIHNELIVSGTRTFNIIGPIDLDTTYFPFGLGYEWTYERHRWEHSDENDWDKYDTFTIRVVDSIFRGDSLIFKLEGGWFQFLDSQVEIWKANKLEIWQFYWKVDTINVAYPQPESLYYKDLGGILGVELFKLGYNVDTLVFYQGEDYGNYGSSRMEKHLKKIGVVYQRKGNWWVGHSGCGDIGATDSLIIFTTPERQRYP